MSIIIAKELVKTYTRGSEQVRALDNVSLTINKGEFVSIVGPSGSGKTTLLNVLGCLDNPDSGMLSVDDQEIFAKHIKLSESVLTKLRRVRFGYIFQKFHLIPTLTILENVLLPGVFAHQDATIVERAKVLINELGLTARIEHLPGQLSGGEMQRVAIARSLLNKPPILMADEPTGNLDSARSKEIGETLSMLNKRDGVTIVMVTHNPELARLASRVIELRDGKILG